MIPPNISATPKTAGSTPAEMKLALIMLSMNVVTANAASASGAELPHSIGLATVAAAAPLYSCVGAIRRSLMAIRRSLMAVVAMISLL